MASPIILCFDRTGSFTSLNTFALSFGGSFGRLRLARLLVYNVQHTLEQRTLIRQYLENFYGIATITLPLTFNSGGAWLDNV